MESNESGRCAPLSLLLPGAPPSLDFSPSGLKSRRVGRLPLSGIFQTNTNRKRRNRDAAPQKSKSTTETGSPNKIDRHAATARPLANRSCQQKIMKSPLQKRSGFFSCARYAKRVDFSGLHPMMMTLAKYAPQSANVYSTRKKDPGTLVTPGLRIDSASPTRYCRAQVTGPNKRKEAAKRKKRKTRLSWTKAGRGRSSRTTLEKGFSAKRAGVRAV